jgi:hypothetical protein
MARVTLRVTLLALTFAVLACLTLAKSPDRVEFLPGYGNVTTTQYAGQLSVSDSKDSQLFYWYVSMAWLPNFPGQPFPKSLPNSVPATDLSFDFFFDFFLG